MTPESPTFVEGNPRFAVEKILVAGNRGPCGGVNMALEATDQVLEIVDGREPVYTLWDVVHNKPIMEEMSKKGLVSVNHNLDLIPDNSVVVLPAHGGPPLIYERAKKSNWELVDVTCQLVTNVKNRTIRAEQEGYHNIYIGQAGHPETMAVLGGLKDDEKSLVETVSDAEALDLPRTARKIVHSQTTLAPRRVKEIEDTLATKFTGKIHDASTDQVFDEIEIPDRLGICYATYNRQEAVLSMVNKIDMLVVVGSQHSHNSKELALTGEVNGRRSHQVDDERDMREEWFEPHVSRVGVTSGASVLDRYMEPVVGWIRKRSANAEVIYESQAIPEKDMTFKLPQASIDSLRARYA